jgi:phosphatidylserine/phosphatidylglycerophosphate/cardiolipin synthase-like enzyme
MNHGSEFNDDQEQSEFVITVPTQYGHDLAYRAKARMTLGVLVQLAAQSKNYFVISSPFITSPNDERSNILDISIFNALQRGVNISVVSTGNGLEAFDISKKYNEFENIHYFRPRINIQNENFLGSHAKFCLSDNMHAYIGSANLTGPGLFENLEMGILVHGRLAKQISKFWRLLIEMEFFVEVNPETT